MTLFNKTVTEAVVEVVKPASTVYHVDLTPEEAAILILAVGHAAGIGTELYRKLRFGVGIADGERVPTLGKSALGHVVVTRASITKTLGLMK